ncbi:MAG: ACT domain-containing protein [Eubacteriales bacterium]|nr:ACT domain-containing protein [Eubacteriales bacterium]
MTLELLPETFCVCKVPPGTALPAGICFFAHTDAETSLVCQSEETPRDCLSREDGWRALRFSGSLDFSLVGILAQAAQVLAREQISIFAVSTFDTDYILLKDKNLSPALLALQASGYDIIPQSRAE